MALEIPSNTPPVESEIETKETNPPVESEIETKSKQENIEPDASQDEEAPKVVQMSSKALAKRLAEERARGIKEAEDKAAEAARQEALTAEEKLKEAKDAAEARVKTLEAENLKTKQKVAIMGEVENPDRVLALIGISENAGDYFDGETPNLEKILEDFPEYAKGETDTSVSTPSIRSKRLPSPDKMTDDEFFKSKVK